MTDGERKRLGILRVTPRFLTLLLGFDAEHEIREARMMPRTQSGGPDDIAVLIVGPLMPEVADGEIVPEVAVTILRTQTGSLQVLEAHKQ